MAQSCGRVPDGCCEPQAVKVPRISALLGTAVCSAVPTDTQREVNTGGEHP